ncbi:MAG: phage portal protein [Pseudomonadota bacterium]
MGAICDLVEKRTGVANPAKWLVDLIGGGPSLSGVSVNETKALGYSPVWAAINIIAGAVGTLPFIVYRNLANGGKEKAKTNRNYNLVRYRPNPYMDALTFRETLQGHVLTWGNGYAEIERDAVNRPVNLWPLRPDRMKLEMRGGELWYVQRMPAGEEVGLPAMNVLHIKGLGFDGFQGYSPIKTHMESIGLGMGAERYGASFFGNASRPAGVLQHPGHMSDDAQERLRNSWNAAHQGLGKQFRMAILEEGMEWKQIGIPPEEAQFIETRRFQIGDAARIYQVPPHMLGDLERATFSNIENQGIAFVTQTLMRWLTRWELECDYKLFSLEQSTYFTEFLVEGLLRGDTQSRYQAYATGRQWGWLSANDVRERENMNPVEGGDEYLVPMNMGLAKDLGKEPEPPPDLPPPEEPPAEPQPNREQIVTANRAALLALCERIVHKEVNAMGRAAKRPDFGQRVAAFYTAHPQHIAAVLKPAVLSFAQSIDGQAIAKIGHGFVEQFGHDESFEASRTLLQEPTEQTLLAWQDHRPQAMVDRICRELIGA